MTSLEALPSFCLGLGAAAGGSAWGRGGGVIKREEDCPPVCSQAAPRGNSALPSGQSFRLRSTGTHTWGEGAERGEGNRDRRAGGHGLRRLGGELFSHTRAHPAPGKGRGTPVARARAGQGVLRLCSGLAKATSTLDKGGLRQLVAAPSLLL